jgi:hypothetical protein
MFRKTISSPMGLGETKTKWFYMKEAEEFLDEVSFEIGKQFIWKKIFLVTVVDIAEPEVKLKFMKFKF